MIEKAKLKIKEEIDKAKDPYVKVIGKYLLEQIEINKEAAEDICKGNKSISKSLGEVKKVAKARAVGNYAYMEDEEVYALVRKYFKLEALQHKILELEAEEIKEKNNIADKEESNVLYPSFNVSLEDFL